MSRRVRRIPRNPKEVFNAAEEAGEALDMCVTNLEALADKLEPADERSTITGSEYMALKHARECLANARRAAEALNLALYPNTALRLARLDTRLLRTS